MEINWIQTVGIVAATCTTASFLPQVIKTIKSKNTKDIENEFAVSYKAGIFDSLKISNNLF